MSCADCKNLNYARHGTIDNVGKLWCEERAEFRDVSDPACDAYVRRQCGNCVVWNGSLVDEDPLVSGGCSVRGLRLSGEAPCRHYWGKRQLNAPLYGKEPKRG